MRKRYSCNGYVAAPPDDVFALISDIERLPEWNAILQEVTERPAELVPGAQWVVRFGAMGQAWRSRATLEELDPVARRFAYRAGTDDGNPSFAQWCWEVAGEGDGSRLTVSFSLNPETFWRRLVLARVRSLQLRRKEVPASIAAVARHLVRAA